MTLPWPAMGMRRLVYRQCGAIGNFLRNATVARIADVQAQHAGPRAARDSRGAWLCYGLRRLLYGSVAGARGLPVAHTFPPHYAKAVAG